MSFEHEHSCYLKNINFVVSFIDRRGKNNHEYVCIISCDTREFIICVFFRVLLDPTWKYSSRIQSKLYINSEKNISLHSTQHIHINNVYAC